MQPSVGRVFHMGRLCPFATRVDLAGWDVRPVPQPDGRFFEGRAFGPRPRKGGQSLGQLPAAASGGRHPSGSPSAQMLRRQGPRQDTCVRPRDRLEAASRPWGRADSRDRPRNGDAPAPAESVARGQARQAKAALSLPASASASGSGRSKAGDPAALDGRRWRGAMPRFANHRPCRPVPRHAG